MLHMTNILTDNEDTQWEIVWEFAPYKQRLWLGVWL
jgi:hypothetical protein